MDVHQNHTACLGALNIGGPNIGFFGDEPAKRAEGIAVGM
jgi:hypothetical protein